MEDMAISMNRKSVLNAIASGIIVTLAAIGILLKYRFHSRLKEHIQLKEEMAAIPYDLEKPFKWRHFVKHT
jgi:hypothetical protein